MRPCFSEDVGQLKLLNDVFSWSFSSCVITAIRKLQIRNFLLPFSDLYRWHACKMNNEMVCKWTSVRYLQPGLDHEVSGGPLRLRHVPVPQQRPLTLPPCSLGLHSCPVKTSSSYCRIMRLFFHRVSLVCRGLVKMYFLPDALSSPLVPL